jgi:hypothetical protein
MHPEILHKHRVSIVFRENNYFAYIESSSVLGKGPTLNDAVSNLAAKIEGIEMDFQAAAVPMFGSKADLVEVDRTEAERSFMLKKLLLKLLFALLFFVAFIQMLAIKVVELPTRIIEKAASMATPQVAHQLLNRASRIDPDTISDLTISSLDAAIRIKEGMREESRTLIAEKIQKLTQTSEANEE